MSTVGTLPDHLRAARSRRMSLLAKWPLGLSLTSWRYMWRVTPLHRHEAPGDPVTDAAPGLPEWLDRSHLQDADAGVGSLFHRRYAVSVRDTDMEPERLMEIITADLDGIAPSELVSFDKVRGRAGEMRRNDEYVVRMPAPWDGPVRVVDVTPTSFWLVTLAGHIEAGQIEFRATTRDGMLGFEIESWARNGDKLAALLYDQMRMAKEVQLHMWTTVLERITEIAGGRLIGGIEIKTRRVAA